MQQAIRRVIVATDVVDSTALGHRADDGALNWSLHDRAARDLIRQHGGLEIGRTDGIYALFDDVADAIGFAIDYHLALATLPIPLRARVGIHAGEVSVRGNTGNDIAQGAIPFEVDGPVLPLAVRVMSIASGEQTLLTRAAASSWTPGAGVRLASHGHWGLKGVEEPTEVLELLQDGRAPTLPADGDKAFQLAHVEGQWWPARRVAHRLPPEANSFVGRIALLRRIDDLVNAGARLVTLLGTGGVGKTRLAARFARLASGRFAGGAWFCDLSSSIDVDTVLQAVARALDVPLGASDPSAQLGAAIAGRGDCLVILDNIEQIAAATNGLLSTWLAAAPEAQFMTTSRVRLGRAEEQVVEVGPMDADEAVAMFEQRAEAMGTNAEALDRGAVTALVTALDRLPLAIELAAARSRTMSPHTMLQRMHERWRWLTIAAPGATPRRATLRAVFDGSWELLPEDERKVLAQASTFEGGFDLDAAEHVLKGGGERWIGDLLQALVDHSLLVRAGEGRFGLLTTVRDYAAERLACDPGAADAAARHWCHFARLLEGNVIEAGFADLENLAAACERAASAGDQAAATACLALAGEVLMLRGPLQRFLALARRVVAIPGLGPGPMAEAQRALGNALYPLGQRDEALAAYRRGLELARAAADPECIVRLSCAIAIPLTRSGDGTGARAMLEQAWPLAQELAQPVRRCAVLNSLGTLAMAEHRLDDAARHFEQALPLARAAGHRRWEGGLLGNLGGVMYLAGRRTEAARRFAESLEIAQAIGDRQWAANARCNLGLMVLEDGDHGRAETLLRAALDSAREIGLLPLEATSSCNLGLLLLDAGRARDSLAALDHAESLATRLADHVLAAQCAQALGRAHATLGEHVAARTAFERALQRAQAGSDSGEQARACCAIAALALDTGDQSAAAQWVERAQSLVDALGSGPETELARELAKLRARPPLQR